jgi:hypothetical protein
MKIYLLKNFLSVLFQVLPRGWRNYRPNSERKWRHKNPKMFPSQWFRHIRQSPHFTYRRHYYVQSDFKEDRWQADRRQEDSQQEDRPQDRRQEDSKQNWRHKNPKMFRHSDSVISESSLHLQENIIMFKGILRKTGDRQTGEDRQQEDRQQEDRRQEDRQTGHRRQADPGWTYRINIMSSTSLI